MSERGHILRGPAKAVVKKLHTDPRRADAVDDGEITLRELLDRLARGKWLILAAVVAGVAAATFWLRLQPPEYTATMVVAPGRADIGALANLAARIEDLAALATLGRVPAEAQAVPDIERYEQLLTSVTLAERLQEEHGVLQRLMPELWDAERQAWLPPEGPLAAAHAAVLGFFGYPGWRPPTAATLAAYLRKKVAIGSLKGTPMRRAWFRHADPVLAADVLGWLHAGAAAMLREDAAAEVASQVAYLERELAGAATDPTRRAALEATLAEQYRVQALLEGGLLSGVELVERPAASDGPTSPGPLPFLALAAAGGLLLGVFLALLLPLLQGRR